MNTNPPLRITHLLHTMAYGGIETVIINWLTNLETTNLDVSLVIFANPGDTQEPFRKAAEDKGLSVDLIPWGNSKPIFKAAKALEKHLEEHQTQVLHTHNTYADIVGLIAGKNKKVKLVSTIYVWEDGGFGLKRKLLQQIDAWVLKKFDLLTAQCEKTIQDSAQWGFDTSKVRLQPSGFRAQPAELSSEERNQLRIERDAHSEKIVVCNVARFYPEKAQDLMLECWAEVIRECPNAVLWIYGVGPLESELKTLCSNLNLDEHVCFMGFASDLALELELCDLQFHPSHNEGIPLAICAGMAAGLPIVASRVGGLPEVIQHEKSGLLYDDGDKQGFIEGLIKLINDQSYREQLGNEAVRFLKEEYSPEYAAQALEASYQSIV